MQLNELTQLMRRHNQLVAPGSESEQWEAFCNQCKNEFGVMPFDDEAYEINVTDANFALFWEAVAEQDYEVAETLGEVPEEWRAE